MKKRYRAISHRVAGRAPGEEFEADSDEFYEEALLGVHLEIVEENDANHDNEPAKRGK